MSEPACTAEGVMTSDTPARLICATGCPSSLPPGTQAPSPGRSGSELITIVVISSAHFVSHFYILVLAAMLPFLKAALGIDYFDVALAMTLFSVCSALGSVLVGRLVDRVSPRPVLAAGLVLSGIASCALGSTMTYTGLIVAAALAGLADAVYHPANYAVLSSEIAPSRMGRAFSIHTFTGFMGGAVAPPVLVGLSLWSSPSTALFAAAFLGPLAALAVLRAPASQTQSRGDEQAVAATSAGPSPAHTLLSGRILALVALFFLLSLSAAGIQNFSAAALVEGYGATLAAANTALASFLGASAVGVLAGGQLADRMGQHGRITAVSLAVAGCLMLLVALMHPGDASILLTMVGAGFLTGVVAPSRDLLVRAAAPPEAIGRTYGLVSAGLGAGNALGPILFGWLLEQGLSRWIFGATAGLMLLTAAVAAACEPRDSRAF
jgi:FSR family fosmidomycin resistance protein-like MFS transporter